MKSFYKYIIVLGALIVLTNGLESCKKLIEVKAPYTSINAGNVYQNSQTAIAVLTGIYAKLSNENNSITASYGDLSSMSLTLSLYADELALYNSDLPNLYSYYTNGLTSINPSKEQAFWSNIFQYVFACNAAIEGLTNNTALPIEVQKQLLGEAKFFRAYCYYYLMNLYGDVPLVLTTDASINANLRKSPVSKVFTQIVNDLLDAKALLNEGYVAADVVKQTSERVRPNKWTAAALLARVYLTGGEYANAVTEASAVIGQSNLYHLETLNRVFIKNNAEAIWQLQPVGTLTNANTGEGNFFILPDTGPVAGSYEFSYPVYLSEHLLNSFEVNDERKTSWVDSVTTMGGTFYYAFKYKVSANNPGGVVSEYLTLFRLGEQYLIRAEAYAQLNQVSNAQADINSIRTRAGLPVTTASTKDALLDAVLHERQVELFTEQGHRWLDLKRLGKADVIMPAVTASKGGTWSSHLKYFPIPLYELQTNPNLVQNAGY